MHPLPYSISQPPPEQEDVRLRDIFWTLVNKLRCLDQLNHGPEAISALTWLRGEAFKRSFDLLELANQNGVIGDQTCDLLDIVSQPSKAKAAGLMIESVKQLNRRLSNAAHTAEEVGLKMSHFKSEAKKITDRITQDLNDRERNSGAIEFKAEYSQNVKEFLNSAEESCILLIRRAEYWRRAIEKMDAGQFTPSVESSDGLTAIRSQWATFSANEKAYRKNFESICKRVFNEGQV